MSHDHHYRVTVVRAFEGIQCKVTWDIRAPNREIAGERALEFSRQPGYDVLHIHAIEGRLD